MSSLLGKEVLLAAMWKKVIAEDHVFLVIESNGAMPYIEEPDYSPQETHCPEGVVESCLLAFTNLEDATSYCQHLVEIHEDLRPSMLGISKITLKDLMGMVDELDAISRDDLGCPLRIDLAQTVNSETLLTDVLYSAFQSQN